MIVKNERHWINETTLSEMLAVPAATLRGWRQRGEGPDFVKLGPRLVRYDLAVVEAWLGDRVSATPRKAG